MESSLGSKLENIEAVVVTGGSSGIGQCFIHQFQRLRKEVEFCNISRKKPDLDPSIFRIHHIPCDLSKSDQIEAAVREVLTFLDGRVGKVLLINNSGFGSYGPFPAPSLEHNLEMIDVNARAAVHLTGRLLPILKERGGAIVNIASTAAFQATPYMATYGATKAFLLHWSLGLAEELRNDHVRVLAVCPGPTATRFFERAGFDQPILSPRLGETPEEVVATIFRALRRQKHLVVSGWMNRVLTGAASLLPRTVAARLSEMVLRKVRLEKIP